MKKITLAIYAFTGLILASNTALADNQTVSIGYAQSKVEDFKNIHGVNLQYRYEFQSPFSLMGSLTWMKGNGDQSYYASRDFVTNHVDVKYYSLLVGPAFRINDYVSLYALGGFAHTKADGDTEWINYGDNAVLHASISEKSTSFAYGLGIIINPVENFSINVGYEGTQADMQRKYSINGFNVGVGYRF